MEAARSEVAGDGGGPEFLAIALDGSPRQAQAVAAAHGYHGPVAVSASEEGILAPLGLRGVPGLAFVRKDGVVAGVAGGKDQGFIARHARELAR